MTTVNKHGHVLKPLVIMVVLVVSLLVAVSLLNHKKIVRNSTIQVVAAENFWGSLVSQIGGSRISVISIVSDPNADPHEYSSNTTNARAFANADYIVLNGAGYDSWADKLISANPGSSRKVLTVATLLDKKEGDNPHFWYSPGYVNQVINQIAQDLINIDPADRSYFQQQYKTLQASLSVYQGRIATIKQLFSGTKVTATEDIFSYLADSSGLNLISPPAFTQAVAEGNDPPTSSVAEFQQQLQSNKVKLLVYNEQTVTPLTNNIKKLAIDQNIPVVGITETVQPQDTTFQDWMNAELINLEDALSNRVHGQS